MSEGDLWQATLSGSDTRTWFTDTAQPHSSLQCLADIRTEMLLASSAPPSLPSPYQSQGSAVAEDIEAERFWRDLYEYSKADKRHIFTDVLGRVMMSVQSRDFDSVRSLLHPFPDLGTCLACVCDAVCVISSSSPRFMFTYSTRRTPCAPFVLE